MLVININICGQIHGRRMKRTQRFSQWDKLFLVEVLAYSNASEQYTLPKQFSIKCQLIFHFVFAICVYIIHQHTHTHLHTCTHALNSVDLTRMLAVIYTQSVFASVWLWICHEIAKMAQNDWEHGLATRIGHITTKLVIMAKRSFNWIATK